MFSVTFREAEDKLERDRILAELEGKGDSAWEWTEWLIKQDMSVFKLILIKQWMNYTNNRKVYHWIKVIKEMIIT